MTIPPVGDVTFRDDPQPRRPRTSSVIAACIIVCLGIAIGLGGLSLYRSGSTATADATRVADQYIDLLQSHRYDEAYALMTPEAQAVMDESSLKNYQELVEKNHGRLLSKGVPQWYIQYYNGSTYVSLTYALSYTHGRSAIRITVQQLGAGRYGIRGFNFQM